VRLSVSVRVNRISNTATPFFSIIIAILFAKVRISENNTKQKGIILFLLSNGSARLCRFYKAKATKRTFERRLKGSANRAKHQKKNYFSLYYFSTKHLQISKKIVSLHLERGENGLRLSTPCLLEVFVTRQAKTNSIPTLYQLYTMSIPTLWLLMGISKVSQGYLYGISMSPPYLLHTSSIPALIVRIRDGLEGE
jgi:hypothetical protein